jgi:hypothetical protein
MNCANFLEYNPKIYIIFWNTIHKIHAFCDYVYQNQTELYKLENIDVHIYVCNLSQSIPVSIREFGAVCFVVCYALTRQKRRSMIKLLHNKCNGRASSSQIKKSSS